MITAIVNAPYSNRIQLALGDWIGPLVQPTSPPRLFDPTRKQDLEIYVDGLPVSVKTASYDAVNNRYLLFMDRDINLKGVIQVIHHMPKPPFQYSVPTIYPSPAAKQTHYVLSTVGSTTINIGGMPSSPESVNDVFTSADKGDIIRVILRNPTGLEDFEATITSVSSPTQAIISQAPAITSTDGEAYWFPPGQDDTAALQALISLKDADGNSIGGTISLGTGVFILTSPLTNVRDTTRIIGQGSWRTTILLRKSNFQNSFTFTDVMALNLEGFSVVGPGMDNVYGGTILLDYKDFSNTERFFAKDVYLRHLGFTGFVVNTPILSTFINCKVEFGAGHGFHVTQNGTTTDFIDCYGITLVGQGFLVEAGSSLIGLHGCASESSGGAVAIVGANTISSATPSCITVDHCDSESQLDRTPPSAAGLTPTLTLNTGGTLTPGTYRLKFCWMHGVTYGVQSAESNPVTVTLGSRTITVSLGTVPTNVFTARIYFTPPNGAPGSEGWMEDIVVVPGTTATYTRSTQLGITVNGVFMPDTVGQAPPDWWYSGHGFVASGAQQVVFDNCHSRDIPDAASRHFLVTDASQDVQIRQPNIVQGVNTPAYDVELTADVFSCKVDASIAAARILDNSTGTNALLNNWLGIGTAKPQQMVHVSNPAGAAYARVQGMVSDGSNFSGVELLGNPGDVLTIGQFVINASGDLEVTFNGGSGWGHPIRITLNTAAVTPASDARNVMLTPGSSGYAILNGNAEHFGADFWGTAVGSEAFRLTGSGYMSWGPGSGSYDVSLYRLSSGELYLLGTLKVTDLTVTDGLTLGNPLPISSGGTDANTASGALASLGAVAASGISAGSVTLAKLTSGGTEGSISWNAGGVITGVVSPT